jgi:hypothetical protein
MFAAFPSLYGVGQGGLYITGGSAAEALRSLPIEDSFPFMGKVLQLWDEFKRGHFLDPSSKRRPESMSKILRQPLSSQQEKRRIVRAQR